MSTTETRFRYYQQEADEAIYNELFLNDKSKCLVKMFCGTGKSLLMRYCRVVQNLNLVVYVVPSLSLLEQFYEDYFIETKDFPLENILRVSSEEGSTTEPVEIIEFLKKIDDKIICITYQSFETLVSILNELELKIDVCIFDEAHHVVGKTYQPLIFDSDVCEKQIFFTATPKKSMYSEDEFDIGMCGNIVYDYSYFRGAMEGYLNPFEIRLDFYTENINASVYESIARAILASGNSRVLTFHADVSKDSNSDTSVLRFVDERLFKKTFDKVLVSEFPEKVGLYTSLKMVALSASIVMRERKRILKQFYETLDNEVFVISSCQTIGEGIDTKKANMCVFVDPKSSFVAITQNIGRIVRKIFGQEKQNSTILIACWVDKTKYLSCDGDKDKCDEVIREDLNKDGNFNGILNVMSALKQESEDLFDACLNYPSTYSPQEIEGNLSKHGYQLEDIVGDGYLVESLEYMLDTEIACDLDEDFDETDEELLARTAEENNVTIEVHSDSLETPIEYYGQEDDASDKEVIRMFRSYDEETEETVYQPIVKKNGSKRNSDRVEPLQRENRFNVKVHTNPDVKVLWNLSGDLDFTKDICSCIIDCEVVDIWPQRLEELKAFIDENERTPSSISKNQEEKLLGRWLSNQTQTYNNNKMKTIRTNLWILFLEEYKEYVISNDEKWAQVLDELKAFINDNKRRPSVGSKDKEEKQLAQWTTDQQKLKNKNKMDANRTSLWTQILEEYKEYFLTDDELWLQKFEALKSFINDNKKKPSEDSKILSVKTLWRWSSNQNTNYKNNKMDSTRSPLWTQFLEEYKEYFLTDDEIWSRKLEELKEFINDKKIRPSLHTTDINENSIASWFGTQQRTYNNNKMDATRSPLWILFLEEHKEYFPTEDDKWFRQFEEVKTFMDATKKRPSTSSKNIEENSLGTWLTNQITNYKNKLQRMSDEKYYKLFQTFLKEYKEYFVSNDEIWFSQLEEVKTFITNNNKTPSSTDKNTTISRLGKWLIQQRINYKKNFRILSNVNNRKSWEQFLEEYEEYFVSNDEIWFKRLEEVKIFINTNKKKPSQQLTDINENRIAVWINQQNYNNNKMDTNRQSLWTQFLEKYKEYFITDDEKWLQNFGELKNFIDVNKKRPTHHSKNINEKLLGSWLIKQSADYKFLKMNEERYNLWTQFLEEYKEYLLTDNEKWLQNLEELKAFIDENKKKPSDKSTNIEEKQLGTWRTNQISNYKYKKNCMKDEELYNIFTKFLEEYKIHFESILFENDEQIEEEFEIIVKPKSKQKKSAKLPKLKEPNAKAIEKVETTEDIFKRTKPLITQFHNKFCKMRSDNLAQHFKDVPSDFAEYHRVRDECFQTFEPVDIPCNRVILELDKIKTKKGGKRVIDMGCGTAKISEHFSKDMRFNFTNYDHVAINETVQVCDISLMPLEDDSVEICIMSLALWGSNCEEYIREALRVLETNGILYIIDSTKRWSEEGMQDGNQLKQMLEKNGFQIQMTVVDKWCYFKCIK